MRLSRIESALERLMDATFNRAFKGPLHPLEIYNALWKTLQDTRVVSAGNTYVANRLIARINPQDMQPLQHLQAQLIEEFERNLVQDIAAQGWRFGAAVLIKFDTVEAQSQGHAKIEAWVEDAPIPATLTDLHGTLGGQIYPLTSGMVLGRGVECTLRIPDDAISRQHCRFDWTFDGWLLSDLTSTNGTFVDQVLTQHPVALRNGAIITLGATRLRFAYDYAAVWPPEVSPAL